MDMHLSYNITNVADIDFFWAKAIGQEASDEACAVIDRIILGFAELVNFGDRRVNLRHQYEPEKMAIIFEQHAADTVAAKIDTAFF